MTKPNHLKALMIAPVLALVATLLVLMGPAAEPAKTQVGPPPP